MLPDIAQFINMKESQYANTLVKRILCYPPPGLMKGFDKGIDEKLFPQSGAFDMTPL